MGRLHLLHLLQQRAQLRLRLHLLRHLGLQAAQRLLHQVLLLRRRRRRRRVAPPLLLRCEQLIRPFAQLPLGREELSRKRRFGLARARRLGAARRLRGLDRLESSLQHHTVRLGLRELDPSVVLRGARAVDLGQQPRVRRRRRRRRLPLLRVAARRHPTRGGAPRSAPACAPRRAAAEAQSE